MYPTSFHDFAQQCLGAFSHFVPDALAAVYRINAQREAHDFQLRGMQPRMHQRYLEYYRDLDPLSPRACEAAGCTVMTLHQGLHRRPSTDNTIYLGFLQRHAVVDVVEVIAMDGACPVAGISLFRMAGTCAFSPQEQANLRPLQGLMQLAARSLAPDNALFDALTAREQQIALLLRDGASNKVLARALGIGLATVKTHLINLFRKLQVGSRTELVARLFVR